MTTDETTPEDTARGLLRELHTFEDFAQPLDVCPNCRNCCGYADPAAINALRERIHSLLSTEDYVDELRADEFARIRQEERERMEAMCSNREEACREEALRNEPDSPGRHLWDARADECARILVAIRQEPATAAEVQREIDACIARDRRGDGETTATPTQPEVGAEVFTRGGRRGTVEEIDPGHPRPIFYVALEDDGDWFYAEELRLPTQPERERVSQCQSRRAGHTPCVLARGHDGWHKNGREVWPQTFAPTPEKETPVPRTEWEDEDRRDYAQTLDAIRAERDAAPLATPSVGEEVAQALEHDARGVRERLGLTACEPPPTQPESALERYERRAEEFRRETGLLAPGKDSPAAAGDDYEERRAAWDEWVAKRAPAPPTQPACVFSWVKCVNPYPHSDPRHCYAIRPTPPTQPEGERRCEVEVWREGYDGERTSDTCDQPLPCETHPAPTPEKETPAPRTESASEWMAGHVDALEKNWSALVDVARAERDTALKARDEAVRELDELALEVGYGERPYGLSAVYRPDGPELAEKWKDERRELAELQGAALDLLPEYTVDDPECGKVGTGPEERIRLAGEELVALRAERNALREERDRLVSKDFRPHTDPACPLSFAPGPDEVCREERNTLRVQRDEYRQEWESATEREQSIAAQWKEADAQVLALREERDRLAREVVERREEVVHFRDLSKRLFAHVSALKGALAEARVAIEHGMHRPHEHNPDPAWRASRCEVFARGILAIDAALSSLPSEPAPTPVYCRRHPGCIWPDGHIPEDVHQTTFSAAPQPSEPEGRCITFIGLRGEVCGKCGVPSWDHPVAAPPPPAKAEGAMDGWTDEPADQLEAAWGLIANAHGGNWERASAAWQEAAARWRERYFRTFVRPAPPSAPPQDHACPSSLVDVPVCATCLEAWPSPADLKRIATSPTSTEPRKEGE